MACETQRELLPAYVDGELDLVHQLEIEAHLSTCPACAKTVQEMREAQQALREALPRYTMPANLLEKIHAVMPPVTPTTPARRSIVHVLGPYLGVAASLAVMLAVGFLVGLQHGQVDRLTQEAVASHTRSLMAQHLMDVISTDQHTVKPWFAGKIDFAPPVVDLTPAGFPLAGGRLDLIDHHTAAALVYRHRNHFINLFIWPQDSAALADRQTRASGYQTQSWSRDGLNFLAVSEIPEAELADFVRAYRTATGE
jgi:anti-sigma factor RsiW